GFCSCTPIYSLKMTASDTELLQQFARNRSEEAFTFLVKRHVNLVYSAALRQVRSSQLAEEVAQSVFLDLSRNAQKLKADTILTSWLYSVTRRTAIDVVRSESRRQPLTETASRMEQLQRERDAAVAKTAELQQENEKLRQAAADTPKLKGEVAR